MSGNDSDNDEDVDNDQDTDADSNDSDQQGAVEQVGEDLADGIMGIMGGDR